MKKYCLDGEIASFDYHDGTGLWSFCGPKSLTAFLARCKDGERVEIEINSPGGSVVAGVEMANAIKNSKAHVVAHVVGIAASMASVIACACDEIVMEEASFMMIHDPWGVAEGNADEMRKEAQLLDQMKAVIMSFYRGKFDRTDEELAALMSDETWYTGAECLANGLKCTVVKSDVQIAAKIGERNFAKMPDAVKALYSSKAIPPEVAAEIEEAKNEAEAAAEADRIAADAKDADLPPVVAAATPDTLPPPPAPVAAAPAPVDAASSPRQDPATASDWEARYKGASKKINELTAKIADLEAKVGDAALETVDHGAVVAERDALKTEAKGLHAQLDALTEVADKAVSQFKEFQDQVKAAGYEDLGALLGAVSGLKADLEKSGKDLAETRERLDHLKQTQTVLTGGVLTPPTESALTYDERMKKARTVDDREKLRAMKKAGKIK